jgi:hypothetical protein
MKSVVTLILMVSLANMAILVFYKHDVSAIFFDAIGRFRLIFENNWSGHEVSMPVLKKPRVVCCLVQVGVFSATADRFMPHILPFLR